MLLSTRIPSSRIVRVLLVPMLIVMAGSAGCKKKVEPPPDPVKAARETTVQAMQPFAVAVNNLKHILDGEPQLTDVLEKLNATEEAFAKVPPNTYPKEDAYFEAYALYNFADSIRSRGVKVAEYTRKGIQAKKDGNPDLMKTYASESAEQSSELHDNCATFLEAYQKYGGKL